MENVIREFVCGKCKETFIPEGPNDLQHAYRADETLCGGLATHDDLGRRMYYWTLLPPTSGMVFACYGSIDAAKAYLLRRVVMKRGWSSSWETVKRGTSYALHRTNSRGKPCEAAQGFRMVRTTARDALRCRFVVLDHNGTPTDFYRHAHGNGQ